ncbi:hypothetical protein [Streptomyces sp. 891-h]|uniref:phage tail tube protein n=1 Tax=Streptomyces sp. 891-h TaxID=2720714 RepID=UPI001FAB2FCA|nr:hypothetical protein [Streptomyces sp. 891-h]UNZ18870.1 hypothetical protein HC362_19300 [Streptomyces sp. 891-h]
MGRPISARDWIFEVEDEDAATATWLTLTKVNSWTLNRGENEEVADTTTNDSDGQYEQDIMQRGATIELTGLYSATTGVQDPAQQYVDTVWTVGVGEASRNRFRYRHKDQTEWTVWEATATPGEVGGEHNAKTTWGVTITRCGPASKETVVAA